MKYRYMQDRRAQWPVSVMARVLEVTRQGFYAWLKRKPSARTLRQQQVVETIRYIHAWSNGTYGSPRMTRELRKTGLVITRKTVERMMRTLGIRVSAKRRYRPTTDSSQTLALAAKLLQRAFDVKHPDKVWLSDFTELPCRNGKAYAVAIMDLCSRRILGMTVSNSMQTRTLLHALDQACRLRKALPH
jgi:putative transposase